MKIKPKKLSNSRDYFEKRVLKEVDNIVFYAFRYCLGRRTYAVATMVEFLLFHWKVLTPNTKYLIQKEIKEALENDKTGMEMDKKEWEKIPNLPV